MYFMHLPWISTKCWECRLEPSRQGTVIILAAGWLLWIVFLFSQTMPALSPATALVMDNFIKRN